MSVLHLDFETRSAVDLKKHGLYVYARDPSTSVLCMAWAFDDEPVQTMQVGQYLPFDVIDHVKNGGEVWAHNATFEREIWNSRFWPATPLRNEQLVCTMAMAYAMALPGSLEGAAAALGVDKRKDLEGKRIMMQLSQPRAVSSDGTVTWWEDDEKFAKLVDYCRQDVEVERAIGRRMMRLSPFETKVWRLDQKINSLGVAVDVDAIRKTLKLVEFEKLRLDARMREVTGNRVASCNATQQIKDYLQYFNVDADSIAKADVSEIMDRSDLKPKAREVLELRAMGAKAATAKLEPMLARAETSGRLQGMFQYSGANTRRFAGRAVQLQNLKRPTMKHDVIEGMITDIKSGTPAASLELMYGPPMVSISDCIRGMLVASPGYDLIVSDFSAIEARCLAWLAGQESTLEVFRRGEDVYVAAARNIYHTPDISPDQRQVGKVAVLALGYQGGVNAFQKMARSHGVRMAPAFEALWASAAPEVQERAQERFKAAGKDLAIGREEFLASELTKIAWRAANPMIVNYWYAAESAMVAAIQYPGESFSFGPCGREVRFKTDGSFLWCRLPSGGTNCYPYPELKDVKTPWDVIKKVPTYKSEGSNQKWVPFTTYGGSIVENICQSVARDLLVEAMLRLDARGYPVVLHVHDEIGCEVPEGFGSLEEMNEIMAEGPAWATGLPLAAAGYRAKRYRK